MSPRFPTRCDVRLRRRDRKAGSALSGKLAIWQAGYQQTSPAGLKYAIGRGMQTEQIILDEDGNWLRPSENPIDAQLVLVFAASGTIESAPLLERIRARYPRARTVAVSAPDNIAGDGVIEKGGSTTAVRFDTAKIEVGSEVLSGPDDSQRAGEALAAKLPLDDLKHVIVLSEGLDVNGTALLRGIKNVLGESVSLTGGLASDGEAFKRTSVGLDEIPAPNRAVAIGLYGASLSIGKGSIGGWTPFGKEMKITRSEGNVAYELGGRPALQVYRDVLGSKAYALPASGLLYPLGIQAPEGGDQLVRTLLAIDDEAGSVTFAGDVPEGYTARLMQADLDTLITAAGSAASDAATSLLPPGVGESLVLMISCIGRKLVLQRRTGEEIRAARRALGSSATFAGFYSYGEISPLNEFEQCQLHNQTMTITAIFETGASSAG